VVSTQLVEIVTLPNIDVNTEMIVRVYANFVGGAGSSSEVNSIVTISDTTEIIDTTPSAAAAFSLSLSTDAHLAAMFSILLTDQTGTTNN
jgi:hypothetical protein